MDRYISNIHKLSSLNEANKSQTISRQVQVSLISIKNPCKVVEKQISSASSLHRLNGNVASKSLPRTACSPVQPVSIPKPNPRAICTIASALRHQKSPDKQQLPQSGTLYDDESPCVGPAARCISETVGEGGTMTVVGVGS